jgi:hypothetical protein
MPDIEMRQKAAAELALTIVEQGSRDGGAKSAAKQVIELSK